MTVMMTFWLSGTPELIQLNKTAKSPERIRLTHKRFGSRRHLVRYGQLYANCESQQASPLYNNISPRPWSREKTLLEDYEGSDSSIVTMTATDTTPKKCIGVDCPNDASSLQCPTCLKLGKESSFCSQDCFKRSWVGYLVPS